jgi:hypothetical protein
VEDGSVKIRLKSQSVGGVWADKHKIVEWINGKPEPAHFSAPAPVVSSIVTSFQEPAEPCDEEEENPCIADLGNEEAEPGDGSRWEEL